jgi:hypothetical protein
MGNILILHIRFDIGAVEKKFDTGAYGMACYQTVFRNVPADLLNGCQVSMGDSLATLNGRENVCIIGLTAPERRLQSIRKVLNQNREFLSICADNPLPLETSFGTEPLVSDGIYTLDGGRLQMWAKSAYDLLKRESPAQPAQPAPQSPPQTQSWSQPRPAAQPQPQPQPRSQQQSQPQPQPRSQQQPQPWSQSQPQLRPAEPYPPQFQPQQQFQPQPQQQQPQPRSQQQPQLWSQSQPQPRPAAPQPPQFQSQQQFQPQSQQQQHQQQPQPSWSQPVQTSPAGATYLDAAQAETLKQRGGCLTAWIFILMIVNTGTAFLLLGMQDRLDLSDGDIIIQFLLLTAIIVGGILLLKWRKTGFYLILAAFLISTVINLAAGNGIYSFSGAMGILILWGLLNKKADGVSAWQQMKL